MNESTVNTRWQYKNIVKAFSNILTTANMIVEN